MDPDDEPMISQEWAKPPEHRTPAQMVWFSELVAALGEDEFLEFWGALGTVLRLGAIAINRHDS